MTRYHKCFDISFSNLLVGFIVGVSALAFVQNYFKSNEMESYQERNRILIFSEISSKVQDSWENGVPQDLMGEVVFFTSAMSALSLLGNKIVIVNSRNEFLAENYLIKAYIVDFKTIKQVKDLILTENSISRVYLLCFWGRSIEVLKSAAWRNGKYHLHEHQVLTPFPYYHRRTSCNNTFLGFLTSSGMLSSSNNNIHLDNNLNNNLKNNNLKNDNLKNSNGNIAHMHFKHHSFDINDKNRNNFVMGYLWGKKKSYINWRFLQDIFASDTSSTSTSTTKQLLLLTTTNNHNTTITYNQTFKYSSQHDSSPMYNIRNLGILTRQGFLSLLKNVKFVIGFGHPRGGTSCVEVFERPIFLLAPSIQLPEPFHNHPNYISLDHKSPQDIKNIIQSIINGSLIPVTKPLPEYTQKQYIFRICRIFNICSPLCSTPLSTDEMNLINESERLIS